MTSESPIVRPRVLCSDGATAYRRFAASSGLEHHPLPSKRKTRVKGVFPTQNINAHHSRLKQCPRPFHGVSTRHLPNYLVWFRLVDGTAALTQEGRSLRLLDEALVAPVEVRTHRLLL